MSLYETLVFVHILAAVVWVGGAVSMQLLASRALAGDGAGLVRTTGELSWVGTRVFMPASLILIGAGVWAVLEHPLWEFSQGWISAGFAVWFISFLVGAGFLGPESGRVKALVDAEGPESPEARRRITRMLWVARGELVLFLAVIYVMVTKPGL